MTSLVGHTVCWHEPDMGDTPQKGEYVRSEGQYLLVKAGRNHKYVDKASVYVILSPDEDEDDGLKDCTKLAVLFSLSVLSGAGQRWVLSDNIYVHLDEGNYNTPSDGYIEDFLDKECNSFVVSNTRGETVRYRFKDVKDTVFINFLRGMSKQVLR